MIIIIILLLLLLSYLLSDSSGTTPQTPQAAGWWRRWRTSVCRTWLQSERAASPRLGKCHNALFEAALLLDIFSQCSFWSCSPSFRLLTTNSVLEAALLSELLSCSFRSWQAFGLSVTMFYQKLPSFQTFLSQRFFRICPSFGLLITMLLWT